MPLGAAHEHRDGPPEETVTVDPTEQAGLLLRDLHTDVHGLLQREADRRLVRFGRNELVRRGGRRRPRQLVQQFTHPLALILAAAAAALAIVAGIAVLAAAIAAVIVLNAALAFVQERQAEAAIESLKDHLPPHATVVRDGREQLVEAALLVPGDIVVLAEGDRISADARLLWGGELVGTWTTRIRKGDLPANHLRNPFSVTISPTGGVDDAPSFQLADGKEPLEGETSTPVVEGSKITLRREGCFVKGSGYRLYDNVYRYAISGDTLTFTVVKNACKDRVAERILTARPFTCSS
jgi:hypothetical protein